MSPEYEPEFWCTAWLHTRDKWNTSNRVVFLSAYLFVGDCEPALPAFSLRRKATKALFFQIVART
jgi:hypothetical protein